MLSQIIINIIVKLDAIHVCKPYFLLSNQFWVLFIIADRLAHDAATIMDDVVDDFARITRIKARMEQWKIKQKDSYEEAYIGLCLPKLFTPLVRLGLINWNPLQVGPLQVSICHVHPIVYWNSTRFSSLTVPFDSAIIAAGQRFPPLPLQCLHAWFWGVLNTSYIHVIHILVECFHIFSSVEYSGVHISVGCFHPPGPS